MSKNRFPLSRNPRHRVSCNSRSLSFESLEDRLVLATVPTGFTDTAIISGGLFTTLQFDQSGRGWVAFDDGRIGVIENDVLINTSAYDLNASTVNDRGLLGLELDRNFSQNGYIYAAYSADDSDPNVKLSRLQVDLTTGNTIIPDSETVLLELPPFSETGGSTLHIVGAIHHAADDSLYLQVGDHELFGVAQDLSLPFGKILRLNTDGTPASGNPYYDTTDGLDWTDYIWSSGVRNAFSGDIDPETGRYFISDVGSSLWEEVNDATQPGLNFGWPSEEGATGNLSFTDPYYAYSHDFGCAISGGTFYSGVTQQFPTEYSGRYFFSEFCGGEIRSVSPTDPTDVQVFATGINGPLNIAFAPDGSMYYIEFFTNTIRKIEYTLDAPPEIFFQPENALVSVGGEVSFSFSVGGSSPFSYQWQVNTGSGFVDLPGEMNAELVLSNLTIAENGLQYRVVVSNDFGTTTSDAALLTVTTDTPPIPQISLSSSSGSTYRAGDTLTFSGTATDAEDGTLSPASFDWRVDFHHNTHTHPVIESLQGTAGDQIVIPITGETDPDVWYRVYLTATDSTGFETTVFEEIFPELSDFTVESTVSAGTVLVDGQTNPNPAKKTGVEDVLRTLTVPEQEASSSGNLYFYEWLDGSTTPQRIISTPQDDTAYVALFGYSEATIETTYLSDLIPVGIPINGWGPIEFDTSNGGQAQGDGGIIALNGVGYSKGLGVHADSEIVFDLNGGGYERFRSDIGLNAGPRDSGEVIFEVYGDGALIYSSGLLNGNSATQFVDVDVTGVSELRLVVDGNGSINSDSANWADARLTKVVSNKQYLSDMTPVGLPINGWGPIELDMSNGSTGQGDGGTLLLNGVAYDKGLGVHADSEVVYSLNGEYERFRSDIGINAGPRPTGDVIFEVYGDGVLVFSSGLITGESATQSIDLDVSGVNELRLVVDGNGSINFDSANWADAHLLQSAPSSELDSLRGISVESGGLQLRLLPYAGADANLDSKLTIDDVQAVVQGWGTRPVEASLQDWIRAGDFNLDGFTDFNDWTILNQAWIDTYSVSLNIVDFFEEQATYLSDLVPIGIPVNGWGPIELDMSNGDIGQGDGGPLLLNGVTYNKGLGVHADSEIVYDLSGGSYDRFVADFGLDAGPRPTGNVVFNVYGDGILLFSSGVITGDSPTQTIDVSVLGVNQLSLVVDGNGSIDFDSANWADARLISYASKEVLLADFDTDGRVGGSDFMAWMRGFGTSNPLAIKPDGDADADADVDANDLAILLDSYASFIPSIQALVAAGATLPEEVPIESAVAPLATPPAVTFFAENSVQEESLIDAALASVLMQDDSKEATYFDYLQELFMAEPSDGEKLVDLVLEEADDDEEVVLENEESDESANSEFDFLAFDHDYSS